MFAIKYNCLDKSCLHLLYVYMDNILIGLEMFGINK